MVNGIPGLPKARVSAPAVTDVEATSLALHVVGPEPASEAEIRRLDIFTKQAMELVGQTVMQPAVERAVQKYLEDHPEAMHKWLIGRVPSDPLAAMDTSLLPIEADKMTKRVVEMSEESKAAAKRKRK
jgi:hypothetical protein